MENQPQHSVQEDFTLTPLTPEFNEDNHRSYVKRINSALQNQKIRNIALSGTYGVGKSSILQKVAEEHKKDVVEISLSTLAPIDPSEASESIPQQASTTTNRIQQEIVKQLLYRVESHNAPRSRFNRIESFNCKREHGIAVLSGIVFTLLFLLMEWTEKVVSIHENISALGAWIHVILFFILASCTFMARYLFQGRVNISQLSTGNAAISLDEKSVSYFDQYLDEIVYFFEVSDKNIVIFEDIDRFEDSHIFETLRSLNTLLNNAPQFKSQPIRFIYAIKDSIFEQAEPQKQKEGEKDFNSKPLEESEIVRANRTKFFDLVIPVVPFITHRSARDLVLQLLSEISHDINDELINIAARYVPDMRLLKNIRNEFIIFREKLFTGDDKQLNLSESELFAMMLFKSTHLSDFELIRLGKSKLDELYQISRKLIAENISQTEQKIRNDQSNLTKNSHTNTKKQSKDLGEQLIELIKCTALSANYQIEGATLTFNDETIATEHLKEVDFWKTFIKSDEQELHYNCIWNDLNYSRRRSMILKFKYSNLPNAFAVANSWTEAEQKDFQASIRTKKLTLKTLRSAHMKELIELSDFCTHHKEKSQSFDAIARSLLSNGLAYQLIKSGYINDNFTLYTSTFHSDVITASAQNFIIHNFEPNIMDEQLVLEESDIKAIISECGVQALSEPCLYNISILNYLLKYDLAEADTMIQSLIQFDDEELRFLQAYLNGENQHTNLIKKFTLETVEILEILVNQVELNDELRLSLVNTALEHLNSELEYNLDDTVSEYLQTHYSELPVLFTSTREIQAENIAKLYSNAVIRVPELKPLSEQIRNAFIAKDLYEINVENLKIALGSETNLALDVALEKDEEIYYYLLRNLGKYLQAVVNTFKTVTSSEHFIRIIDDVLASKNPDDLDEVISHASDQCIIKTLDDVQTDAWQCLADFNRFTATFDNINSYIATFGKIDKSLEKVLIENDSITECELATESESETKKETLAVHILNANKYNLTAEQRVQLVKSLDLTKHYIHAKDLPTEKGELFPLLLKGKIIKDCADTYEHLLATDWSTRAHYIEASTKFLEYITPALLQGDLAAFLASKKIKLDTKASIVERAEEFTEDCSKNDLIELAQFAIEQGQVLAIDVIKKMANNGVKDQSILKLLRSHLDEISLTQLTDILNSMKGDYPKLTVANKGSAQVPNNEENIKLLTILQQHEIVSTFPPTSDPILKVYMRGKGKKNN